MAQIVKVVDLTKSYMPGDPNAFPDNLHFTQREDAPDQFLPILMYEGYNFLPTSYGYRSYFGTESALTLEALPKPCDEIITFQSDTYQNVLIAFCSDGIRTATAGATVWTLAVPLPDDYTNLGKYKQYTWCVIENNLYIYRQGHTHVIEIDSNLAITYHVPSFLNMAGQMGIFRGNGRLCFWDSENSVSWSSAFNLFDLTPSIENMVGNTIFLGVLGRIVNIIPHGEGYVVYATRSIVGVTYSTTGTVVWDASTITSAGGITHPKAACVGQGNEQHFAYTTVGIVTIGHFNALSKSYAMEVILPELFDFLKESRDPVYLQCHAARFLYFSLINDNYINGITSFSQVTLPGLKIPPIIVDVPYINSVASHTNVGPKTGLTMLYNFLRNPTNNLRVDETAKVFDQPLWIAAFDMPIIPSSAIGSGIFDLSANINSFNEKCLQSITNVPTLTPSGPARANPSDNWGASPMQALIAQVLPNLKSFTPDVFNVANKLTASDSNFNPISRRRNAIDLYNAWQGVWDEFDSRHLVDYATSVVDALGVTQTATINNFTWTNGVVSFGGPHVTYVPLKDSVTNIFTFATVNDAKLRASDAAKINGRPCLTITRGYAKGLKITTTVTAVRRISSIQNEPGVSYFAKYKVPSAYRRARFANDGPFMHTINIFNSGGTILDGAERFEMTNHFSDSIESILKAITQISHGGYTFTLNPATYTNSSPGSTNNMGPTGFDNIPIQYTKNGVTSQGFIAIAGNNLNNFYRTRISDAGFNGSIIPGDWPTTENAGSSAGNNVGHEWCLSMIYNRGASYRDVNNQYYISYTSANIYPTTGSTVEKKIGVSGNWYEVHAKSRTGVAIAPVLYQEQNMYKDVYEVDYVLNMEVIQAQDNNFLSSSTFNLTLEDILLCDNEFNNPNTISTLSTNLLDISKFRWGNFEQTPANDTERLIPNTLCSTPPAATSFRTSACTYNVFKYPLAALPNTFNVEEFLDHSLGLIVNQNSNLGPIPNITEPVSCVIGGWEDPNLPDVVIEIDFTYPGATFTLQNGIPVPAYPTLVGSLVFDTQLKKWGKQADTFKCLLQFSPINATNNEAITYTNFGMDSGILYEADSKIRLFSVKNKSSQCRWGKIALYRLGFTEMLEVTFNFRTNSTGKIIVDGSTDGRELDTNIQHEESFTDVRQYVVKCHVAAMWHTISISGNFDLQYLEFRAIMASRR